MASMRTATVVLDVLRDETRRQQSQVKRDGRLWLYGYRRMHRYRCDVRCDWRRACRRLHLVLLCKMPF
jgi:hypothetical protein